MNHAEKSFRSRRSAFRISHILFVLGLILVLGPEEYPPVIGPLWPALGVKLLGLIIFLGAMGVMAHDKYNP